MFITKCLTYSRSDEEVRESEYVFWVCMCVCVFGVGGFVCVCVCVCLFVSHVTVMKEV